MGRKTGRKPIKWSDEELVQLGEELLAWLLSNVDNKKIVHLSQWWVTIKDISRSEWKEICDRVLFTPYYEKALEIMHYKTLLNDKLPTAYGSRYLGIYSKELRQHEKEERDDKIRSEMEMKAKAIASITEEDKRYNQAIVDGISALQEARKMELSKMMSE